MHDIFPNDSDIMEQWAHDLEYDVMILNSDSNQNRIFQGTSYARSGVAIV